VEWTGHHGGHYGSHRMGHLRAYVLPILQPSTPSCTSAGASSMFGP
jgi:hypothetical protein